MVLGLGKFQSWADWGCDGLLESLRSRWAGQEGSGFLSFLPPAVSPARGLFFLFFWYFEVEVSNTPLAVKAQGRVCPVARSLICRSPRCHWRVDNSWSVAPHQTDASKVFFELFGASLVSQRDSWLEFWELCHLLAPACRWLLPFGEGQKTSNSHGRVTERQTCRQWNVSSIWSDYTCN